MRLVDADELKQFPYLAESGTKDMITDWIYECGLNDLELYVTEDCHIDVEQALKDLCQKVIEGFINVIDTQPTAYDVEKVCKELFMESRFVCDYNMVELDLADEIVRKGGVQNG